MVEALYVEEQSYISQIWMELKKERKRFLSKQVVKQYLAFAIGQLKQALNKAQDKKNLIML